MPVMLATLRAPRPRIAHAVDVGVECCRVGVHLEVDRLADVHADLRGKALNAGIARAAHVPLRLRRAGQLVLADDRVRPALRGQTSERGREAASRIAAAIAAASM